MALGGHHIIENHQIEAESSQSGGLVNALAEHSMQNLWPTAEA
jgi:hypothetical protein